MCRKLALSARNVQSIREMALEGGGRAKAQGQHERQVPQKSTERRNQVDQRPVKCRQLSATARERSGTQKTTHRRREPHGPLQLSESGRLTKCRRRRPKTCLPLAESEQSNLYTKGVFSTMAVKTKKNSTIQKQSGPTEK